MADERNPDDTRAAIRDVIRELGVEAPGTDADTLADRLADAVANPAQRADDGGAADAHVSSPEATDGNEHADDAADQATARDIASGKVVEPAEGGVVEPVDG